MKKNTKIIIGSIVGVIVLVLLIILIRENTLNADEKLDKSNPMTREEIISLLDKGAEYKNFYYAPDAEGGLKTEYYIKDNIVVCYIEGRLASYTNYNTKEVITVIGDSNIVFSNNATKPKTSQYGYDYSIVLEENGYEYEYLGEMQEDNRIIIVIKLKKNGNYVKYYIDKESGLVFRRRDVNKGLITTYAHTSNRNVELDGVTAEKVQPDFSSYSVMNNNVNANNNK